MTLTPFEKAEQGRTKTALLSATVSAASEMAELLSDCQIQINLYRDLLMLGDSAKAERAEEKDITVQAMKDMKLANKVIVTLATTLEEEFGISA